MARPSKPVALLKSEKKSHRTKAELESRVKEENKLKTGNDFNVLPQVKNDIIAHKEFLRLKRLYKKIEYIDGLDEQIINRYCLLISKQYKLEKRMIGIENDISNCEEIELRVKLYSNINALQTSINKVQDMLLKIEDRMLMNVSARIKSIPKKEKVEIDENAAMFGD